MKRVIDLINALVSSSLLPNIRAILKLLGIKVAHNVPDKAALKTKKLLRKTLSQLHTSLDTNRALQNAYASSDTLTTSQVLSSMKREEDLILKEIQTIESILNSIESASSLTP